MTAMPAVATNVYRVLVHLYPPGFRREFASEMACDFEDATSEAWHDGRWLAVVPLWIHISHDLARTIAAQWLRHGLPVMTMLAAVGATMFVFAVTSWLRQPLQPVALAPTDDDARVLLLLAVMVILLAATVIVFTVCFWLLVLERNRRTRRV